MPTLEELLQKSAIPTQQAQQPKGKTLDDFLGGKKQDEMLAPKENKNKKGFLTRLKEKVTQTIDTGNIGIRQEIEKDIAGQQTQASTFVRSVGRGLGAFADMTADVAQTIYEELPEDIRGRVSEVGNKIVTDVIQAQKQKAARLRIERPKEQAEVDQLVSDVQLMIEDPEFRFKFAPVVGTLDAFGVVSGGAWIKKFSNKTFSEAKNVAITLSKAKNISKIPEIPETKFLSKPIPGSLTENSKLETAKSILQKEADPQKRREAVSTILEIKEAQSPKVSLGEKAVIKKQELSGVRQDLRERIENNPDEFLNYLDVATLRNKSDLNPSAMAYGAQKVQLAESIIEDKLNDTGGLIGKFREKHGNELLDTASLLDIDIAFSNELKKLNLRVVDDKIVQIPNKPIKVTSPAEIKALSDIRNNLEIVYKNPTLENAIETRTIIDKVINFEKSKREISDQLDGVNKGVRAAIAEANRKNIPVEQVQLLQDYSNLIEALNEIRDFTKRKAGEEYLLRVVLSARGREAGDVIETVKKYTGMDLMDDAQFAKIATELLGNADQKTLLQQNLNAAASLGASLTTGKPSVAASGLFNLAKEKVFDPERNFRQVAERAKRVGPTRQSAEFLTTHKIDNKK